jgi:hypothetical protein
MSALDIYRPSIKMGVYPCNSALKRVDPPIMKKVPFGAPSICKFYDDCVYRPFFFGKGRGDQACLNNF